jgi:hypothetical protein
MLALRRESRAGSALALESRGAKWIMSLRGPIMEEQTELHP